MLGRWNEEKTKINMFIFWTSLIIFLFTVAVFHFILKSTTKKFWILIDYFWISLGFIGILGASISFDKRINETKLDWVKFDYKRDLETLIDIVADNSKMFTEKYDYNSFKDTKIKNVYLEHGKLFREYKDTLKNIKEKLYIRDVNSTTHLYILRERLLAFKKNKVSLQVDDEVILQINKVLNYEHKITEIQFKIWDDNFESWLSFIAPFILAFAIGLRITKVTAQLKGLA